MPQRKWGSAGWGMSILPGGRGWEHNTPPASGGGGGGIVTAGLVLHLDAGDASSYPGTGSTWTDLVSGNAYTFSAAPTYDAAAGFFNFASNHATGTPSPAINPTRGAVEIWFRWRSASAVSTAVLLTGGVNWAAVGNVTGTLGDESYEFFTGVSACMDYRNGHNYLKDNNWHQAVAVVDGSVNQLYIDGSPVSTHFRTGSSTSTGLMNLASVIIGKYSSGYQFDGDIGIIRVYDTGSGTFSAADVAQNYAANSARFTAFRPDNISSLRFWLDPSDASSVTTSSGNIVSIQDKALVLPSASAVSAVGNEPALTTVGGINWMQFDDSNTEYQTLKKSSGATNITGSDLYGGGTDSWEIVMVLRPDGATTNSSTTYQNNGVYGDTGGYIGVYVKDPSTGNLDVMSYMWDSTDRSATLSQAASTKVIFGHSKSAGTQPWSTWVNGSQAAVATYGNLGSTPGLHHIGRGYNTYYYDGLIGEVCVFNDELSASDRASLVAYLSAKWSV